MASRYYYDRDYTMSDPGERYRKERESREEYDWEERAPRDRSGMYEEDPEYGGRYESGWEKRKPGNCHEGGWEKDDCFKKPCHKEEFTCSFPFKVEVRIIPCCKGKEPHYRAF